MLAVQPSVEGEPISHTDRVMQITITYLSASPSLVSAAFQRSLEGTGVIAVLHSDAGSGTLPQMPGGSPPVSPAPQPPTLPTLHPPLMGHGRIRALNAQPTDRTLCVSISIDAEVSASSAADGMQVSSKEYASVFYGHRIGDVVHAGIV